MKKLFVQFYLLLFVCFLVMTLLVGLVYKFTAERAGRQSLDDLMKSSLYLMRSELREIPPREWGKTLKEMDLNLSFDLRVEPLNHYKLDAATTQRLREGDIVALDDQYTFIQRIPRSHYVLAVGPVPYLYFLHQMRLLDIALMALIAFSLAFPVFIWLALNSVACDFRTENVRVIRMASRVIFMAWRFRVVVRVTDSP
ncbi:hypothetical protein MJL04_23605, partial [Salmonella enterica subsp. enterica serovar Lubbock]|nr:hypothetical protein [Salmonella enterica subsp. enterica serovar Lubbock]